jgi:type IV secretion system protein VirB8
MQFREFIKSLTSGKKGDKAQQVKSDVDKTNWQHERYENMVSQRNLFIFLIALSLLVIIASIIAMIHVVDSKKIDPFVIQVDESTGAAAIVNPLTSEMLSADESLARYFIKQYIRYRETYNPVDFDTYARKYIKLTSTDSVYRAYFRFINDKTNDPRILYGATNVTYMKAKSWSKLANNKYMCRFSVHQTLGDMKVFNKLAVVDIDYVQMDLSEDDLDINPVGFQVTNYRVDDDNS